MTLLEIQKHIAQKVGADQADIEVNIRSAHLESYDHAKYLFILATQLDPINKCSEHMIYVRGKMTGEFSKEKRRGQSRNSQGMIYQTEYDVKVYEDLNEEKISKLSFA